MQFLAAFTALLGAFCMGLTLTWTSPAISSMQNEQVVDSEMSLISKYSNANAHNETTTRFLDKDNTELISWIISIINIGGLVGSFFAGNICEWLGHRVFLCLSGLLCALGWLCVSLAINTNMVLVGRFVTGLAIGCLSSSVNVYIVEISTMKYRGFLGCNFQVFIVLGILSISVAGVFVEWRLLSQLCIIPAVLLSILIFFFPESPFWLVKKGREEEALQSLKRLRTNEDCEMELNLIIEQVHHANRPTDSESLNEEAVSTEGSLRSGESAPNRYIVDSVIDDRNAEETRSVDSAEKSENEVIPISKSSFLKDIKRAHVWKPLLFGLIIMVFQQLSGSNSLLGQLQDILNSSKINKLNEQQAAIIGECQRDLITRQIH